jgi:beta-lactamase class D
MQLRLLSFVVVVLLLVACGKSRIKEHKDWGTIFQKHGISNACIMIRDNNHEAIHFYNKDRCLTRYTPASTFKIFNSLVGLETGVIPDDQFVIRWDSVKRQREECNQDQALKMDQMRTSIQTANDSVHTAFDTFVQQDSTDMSSTALE